MSGDQAHLEVHTTSRGFKHLPSIPSTYGDGPAYVRVYESSNASGPHLWFMVKEDSAEAFAHLTVEDAVRLAEQILYLVEHHYQNS